MIHKLTRKTFSSALNLSFYRFSSHAPLDPNKKIVVEEN